MYHRGEGVAKNSAEAFKRFQKASAGGNTDAMRSLALMYQQGDGVPKDLVEADRWFLTAVAHGDETARVDAAVLQRQMTLEQVQEAQKPRSEPLLRTS